MRKQDEENECMVDSAHPCNASVLLRRVKDHEANVVDHLALVVSLQSRSPKHRRDNLVRCVSTFNKLIVMDNMDEEKTDRRETRLSWGG